MKTIKHPCFTRILVSASLVLSTSLYLGNVSASTDYYGAISLYDLFQTSGFYPVELTANRLSEGESEIDLRIVSDYILYDGIPQNVLLFHIKGIYNNSTGQYDIQSFPYTDPLNSLGPIAQNYPDPWQSIDIKSAALAAKNYFITTQWQSYNKDKIFYDFLGTWIPVRVILDSMNAQLVSCYIPGLGEFYSNGKVSETLRFDILHPSRDSNNISAMSREWIDLKNPPQDPDIIDLKHAAHRGFWGNDLGRGPVENSDPAIAAALNFTNIIESDIMITGDNILVVSHDYNLQRLTDYSGPNPDNTYIFQLNFSQLEDLHLRRRNFDVSDYRFMSLADMLNLMKQYKTVLTIDVKEQIKRTNPVTGECIAFCDIDAEKRAQLWIDILESIFSIAQQQDAWEYIAVKVPYTINRIKELLPPDKYRYLNKMLFFPVIQPGVRQENAVNIVSDWYNNAPNLLIGYETVFKTNDSPCLQPLSIEGIRYENMLHFVAERTRLRPGTYPEEPGGPKGTADRWAQWRFKDPTTDYRGDHFWLMSIPYFRTSILTNDRPDIWQEVVKLYQ